MASKIKTIGDAIDFKTIIQAKYQGDAGAVRTFCPHVLGNSSSGQKVVLCFQFAGYSGVPIDPSLPIKNWRCLRLSKLKNVVAVTGPWRSATNYSAVKQKNVKTIDKKV